MLTVVPVSSKTELNWEPIKPFGCGDNFEIVETHPDENDNATRYSLCKTLEMHFTSDDEVPEKCVLSVSGRSVNFIQKLCNWAAELGYYTRYDRVAKTITVGTVEIAPF